MIRPSLPFSANLHLLLFDEKNNDDGARVEQRGW